MINYCLRYDNYRTNRRGGSLTLPLILQSKISSPKAKNEYFPAENSKLLRNLGGRVRDPPLRLVRS